MRTIKGSNGVSGTIGPDVRNKPIAKSVALAIRAHTTGTQPQVAEKFGVSWMTVNRIRNGVHWSARYNDAGYLKRNG
jgi:hypothetical protein